MDEAKFNKWCVVMFFLLMMFMDTISVSLNLLITMSYHGAMMDPNDDPEDPVEGEEASDQAAATPDFAQLNENVIKGNVCHDEQSKWKLINLKICPKNYEQSLKPKLNINYDTYVRLDFMWM